MIGGVIAAYNKATVQVVKSTFSSNKAALGGVFSGQYQSTFTAASCSFKNNIGNCFIEGKFFFIAFTYFFFGLIYTVFLQLLNTGALGTSLSDRHCNYSSAVSRAVSVVSMEGLF
jgi:hypothetical protein